MNILIVGGSGGIGTALIELILERHKDDTQLQLFCTYFTREPSIHHSQVSWFRVDCSSESSIVDLAKHIPKLDWLINTVGVLSTEQASPEKTIKSFDLEHFYQSVATNTLPTLLLAKHFSHHFKADVNTIFATISARVGSIADNHLGGWYSYRSSKAALNMALKTLSIEWGRNQKNLCVAALHPGTVNTRLSQPFQSRVPEKKLFTPSQSANYLLDIIEQLTPDKTGQFWAWDGQQIPW